jgi:hypothetical protein
MAPTSATREFMVRTLILVAIVVVVVVAVAAAAWFVYRMTRRDPPGHYDAQPMHPGFRSNRGRGR